jgi:streptogramin lyase
MRASVVLGLLAYVALCVPAAGADRLPYGVRAFPLPKQLQLSQTSVPPDELVGTASDVWFLAFSSSGGERLWRMSPSGRLTGYPAPSAQAPIVTGPDGSVWYVSSEGLNKFEGRGGRTVAPNSKLPQGGGETFTVGPGGNAWLVSSDDFCNSLRVTEVTGNGTITSYGSFPGCAQVSTSVSEQVAVGSDGALWWLEQGGTNIDRYVAGAGTYTSFDTRAFDGLQELIPGPAGDLWGDPYGGDPGIYAIAPNGAVARYALPPYSHQALDGESYLAAGPDGALWFQFATAKGLSGLGRLDTAGNVEYYGLPSTVFFKALTPGPDGSLWAVASVNQNAQIWRLSPGLVPTSCGQAGLGISKPVPRPVLMTGDLKASASLSSLALSETDLIPWAIKLGLVFVPVVGEEEIIAFELDDVLSTGIEMGLDRIVEDPPDRLYKRIAHLVLPHLPAIRPGRHLSRRVARRLASLVKGDARVVALELTYVHAVERAEGAAKAHAWAWVTRQNQQAARWAAELSTELRTLRRLRARLPGTLHGSPIAHLHASAAKLRKARRILARRGLPSSSTTLLRRFGFGRADLESVRHELGRTPITARRLSAAVDPPLLSRGLRSTATAVGSYARRARCVAREAR